MNSSRAAISGHRSGRVGFRSLRFSDAAETETPRPACSCSSQRRACRARRSPGSSRRCRASSTIFTSRNCRRMRLVRPQAGVDHEQHEVVQLLASVLPLLVLRVARAFARRRVELLVFLGREPSAMRRYCPKSCRARKGSGRRQSSRAVRRFSAPGAGRRSPDACVLRDGCRRFALHDLFLALDPIFLNLGAA